MPVSYTHLDVYKRQGLPFRSLIGCDLLREHSAIIDLSSDKLTLKTSNTDWIADIIGNR